MSAFELCLFFFYLSHPHSLTQVIRKFAKQLDEWLKIALHDLPENLRNIKFECKYKILPSPHISSLFKHKLSMNNNCIYNCIYIFCIFSVQEVFSDSKTADILKPSMSGVYQAPGVILY